MEKSCTLYYFTASYPWGLGETWKTNELNLIKDKFSEIVVIPYSYGGNVNNPKTLPAGVKAVTPLFETEKMSLSAPDIFKLFDRHCFYYFKEFFSQKVFMRKKKLISWLIASLNIQKLLKKELIAEIMVKPDKNKILCFFWGKGSCYFLPFINRHQFRNVVVRFHRYDLIEEENDNYIPFQRQLINALGIAAPSSLNGVVYLQNKYPTYKNKVRLVRLGVRDSGVVSKSDDGVLRIFSCSYVIPVKRVALIAESIKLLKFPVEWTHIGDGPLMAEVREIVTNFPPNIQTVFPGMIDANQLMAYYKKQKMDLFINLSTSEGVAMSILESLSIGVPVFATDVGGSGEAVDDEVGCLLPSDPEPTLVASRLAEYYDLPEAEKQVKRQAARARFLRMASLDRLTNEFVQMITSEQPD